MLEEALGDTYEAHLISREIKSCSSRSITFSSISSIIPAVCDTRLFPSTTFAAASSMAMKEDSQYRTYELQSRDGSPARGSGSEHDTADMTRMGKQQELRVRCRGPGPFICRD